MLAGTIGKTIVGVALVAFFLQLIGALGAVYITVIPTTRIEAEATAVPAKQKKPWQTGPGRFG